MTSIDRLWADRFDRYGGELILLWDKYTLQCMGIEQWRGTTGGPFSAISAAQLENRYLQWNSECLAYLNERGFDVHRLRTLEKEAVRCLQEPFARQNAERFRELIKEQVSLLQSVAHTTESPADPQARGLEFMIQYLRRRKVAVWQLIVAIMALIAAVSYYIVSVALQMQRWP